MGRDAAFKLLDLKKVWQMQISDLASHKLRKFFSPTGVQGFARARDVALVLRISVSRRVVFSQVCATARTPDHVFLQ